MSELRSLEIRLWADGDRLRCDAPAGALTPTLKQKLQELKGEILQFLRSAEAVSKQQRSVVPLQAAGTQIPIYAIPGHNGDVFAYRTMSSLLGDDQPLFGLQPMGFDDHTEPFTSVEPLARYFADQIQGFQPAGPCIIMGFCAGGTIAFELACELQRRGRDVRHLILFAAPFPLAFRHIAGRKRRERLAVHVKALLRTPPTRWVHYVKDLRARLQMQRESENLERAERARDEMMVLREKLEEATVHAVSHYQPGRYAGRVSHMLPSRAWERAPTDPLRWRTVISDLHYYYGHEGTTMEVMLRGPDTPTFAEHVRMAIGTARQ
jgi:thioesterase domain-containing protein